MHHDLHNSNYLINIDSNDTWHTNNNAVLDRAPNTPTSVTLIEPTASAYLRFLWVMHIYILKKNNSYFRACEKYPSIESLTNLYFD
jgi:hypothetical protein